MRFNFKTLLQMFADGGEGAAPAAAEGSVDTGSNTADSGRNRLKVLGVPEGRMKNRQYNLPPMRKAEATAPAQAAESQPVPGTDDTPKEAKEPTFDDFTKKYSKEIQSLINNRLKGAKDAEAKLNAIGPMIQSLAKEHNMDPENLDYIALTNAVTGAYAEKAAKMGVSEEIAMQLDQQQRQIDRQNELQRLFQERLQFDNHMAGLRAQAEDLKKVFPNFDLDAEMDSNETFRKLTGPGGVSVADAYWALHHQEIQTASMQAAVQQGQKKAAAAIQSGMARPKENGASSQAPSVTTFDFSRATAADKARIRAEMQRAAANGQRVTPSMFYRK